MTNSVTVNGNTYNDGNVAPNNMGAGGHRDYLIPMLSDAVSDLAAKQSAAATANGVLAITYVFSTTTADSDPGAGALRLDNATQNAATTIRADVLDSLGIDWTTVLNTFDASSSAVKGQIRLSKIADGTKWLTFNVTARATPAGYRNFTVANTGSSSANPFANGDPLLLAFTRSGDIGSTGPAGSLIRRVTSIASSATPTPDSATTDAYVITALAVPATFGAPTGAPVNEQGLTIRIKDNGTARALAFNATYRASTDLALPTTTIANKTLRIGFMYNSADSKWDLVGVLNNI